MDTVGGTVRRLKKMLDIPNVIEELHSMLEKHVDAICNIEYISLDGKAEEKVWSTRTWLDLEESIPLLFQADIDQWTLTDVRTEGYMAVTGPRTFIYVKLMRCL